MSNPLPTPSPEQRETLAKAMFEIDWPDDKWERHILQRGPDAAARRYLAMAEPCVAALASAEARGRDKVMEEAAQCIEAQIVVIEAREAPLHLPEKLRRLEKELMATMAQFCRDLATVLRAKAPPAPEGKSDG